MKKVFLTLAVVVAMAWGSNLTAQTTDLNPEICQDVIINCGNGTSGYAVLCGRAGERLSQVAVWYDLICN